MALRAEPTDTEPGWYTEFGELLPAEILASLADALIAPTSTQRPKPLPVLESAGWQLGPRNTAVSPDTMCHVEQRTDQGDHARAYWHVETCEPGHGTPMGPRIWHAWFDGNTPEHLVSAFVTALADPAPLQRAMYERTAHYSVVQLPSPLTPQQSVDAHTTRICALRAQARVARQQRQKPTKAPAPTGTARTAARR